MSNESRWFEKWIEPFRVCIYEGWEAEGVRQYVKIYEYDCKKCKKYIGTMKNIFSSPQDKEASLRWYLVDGEIPEMEKDGTYHFGCVDWSR